MCMLSIVIPVYNGSATIRDLVNALKALDIPGGHEIILVDDGSQDNSAQACQALVQSISEIPICFIQLAKNFGEHNAVMAGLHRAKGDYVITMDDDFQNPPKEVPRLLESALSSKKDVIYTYDFRAGHGMARRIGSRFANVTADILLNKPRGLYLSSFRCMKRFVVNEVVKYSGPHPYIDGIILDVTQSVSAIEVENPARVHGKSNYTMTRLFSLWLSIVMNHSLVPLRVGLFVGAALSVSSMVLMAVALVRSMFWNDAIVGWEAVLLVVMLMSGVQILLTGIVGEYIGRIYQIAGSRPQYVVAEAIDNGCR